jgi:NADH:ubiquinone reductase (H+-translocating)
MNPRCVIVGGGFGGIEAAKALGNSDIGVTLIDRKNHHVFQPLLYQVATAGLSPADIAAPLRSILRRYDNVEVLLANVQRVDVAGRKVVTDDDDVPYDYLILAAGSRHSYFGHGDWERFAPGLKTLEDALEIRRRILMAFERAEKAEDEPSRSAALTFVIVGAGPTGVEMAGAIAELARYTLARDFRHIDPSHAHILLVDMMPRVLPTFAEDLSQSAQKQLEELGIEVRCNVAVQNLKRDGVELKSKEGSLEFIPSNTVIWAAGNAAATIGQSLNVPLDRAGRVIVNEDLTIPGHPEIQVIGDLANFAHTPNGKPLPGVSPVAMQQGRHAARNVKSMIAGERPKEFIYWDKGAMATIGRNRAVADLRWIRFGGFPAWVAWLLIHLVFLVGFRNKASVLANWAYHYFTYGRGARLITNKVSDGG